MILRKFQKFQWTTNWEIKLAKLKWILFSAVPGIDAAFMAMDMDEGLEVIWNEVTFSESKDYQAQEKQMKSSLDTMIAVTHANIVKVITPEFNSTG